MNAKWLRALLKSNVLAMGCWRVGGHLTAKNDALLRLIGYKQKELIAKNIRMRDITPPEFWPLVELAFEEAQASGECTPYEKEIIHKSGRRIPVLAGGSVFGNGVTDAGAFYFIDLRQRRRTIKDPKRVIPPALLSFSDRQRAICLLLSYGEPEKRVASMLDVGVRTVELDKHRAAQQLNIPISRVVVWSVENRYGLVSTFQDFNLIPASVARIVRRVCGPKSSTA
jgi:PAS domain S-box-containing protein